MFRTAQILLRNHSYLLRKRLHLARRLRAEHGYPVREAWRLAGVVQRQALILGHELRVEA